MLGIKRDIIQGKTITYTKLTALSGYCFYDVDAPKKHYITSITTPITDYNELERKYVSVYGNAKELNKNSEVMEE